MNNKILKAISIGIATMMAMNPITALAEEVSESTVPEGTDTELEQENENQSAEEQATAVAEEAEEIISWATVTGSEAVDTILEGDELFTGIMDGEVVNEEGVDLSAVAKDAAEAFEEAVVPEEEVTEAEEIAEEEDITEEEDMTEEDAEITEPEQSHMEDAADAVEEVIEDLVIADAAADVAENALDTAEKAVDTAEDVATEAEELVEQANTDMQAATEEITNATTQEEAQEAYDTVEQIKDDAKAELEEKKEAFEEAETEYEAAVEEFEEQKDIYNASVEEAEAEAQVAAEELKEAKELADEMTEAMEAAKAEVDSDASAAMDIIEKQETVADNTSVNWREEDKLFESIMENYYLPEQMGIEGATVKRVQGPDNDEFNYFTATYTDENGETKTSYFNYKMEEGSKSQIVIFEKREEEIKVWDDLDGDGEVDGVSPDEYDEYAVADENGNATKETVSVEEVEAGVADGSIVEVEDAVVQTNEVTETEELVVEETVETENGEQDIIIAEETKEESFAFDEEGNLVKTVTADVTTITYTNATFESEETYEDAAARDEAASAKEAELEQANDGKDAVVTN
ncbi:MAG: hypothetical protein E7287_05925, partial [Lachnospiraceae bacterium]|nr:hypothetical protein [Lachnospiraceae bacterium]